VKSEDLRPLFERARKMSQGFASFKIEHVYREQNAEADALANEALDETAGRPASQPTRDASSSRMAATRKIRARVRNGTLIPAEAVELPEGSEVEILIRPITKT
jgi:hypothetical protein